MWADWEDHPWRHYYINEPAQTLDGSYVILHQWIVVNKQMKVRVYSVDQDMVWGIFSMSSELVLILPRMVLSLFVVILLRRSMQRT